MQTEVVRVPRFYQPYPYQQAAWMRRAAGKYDYYVKLWARQLGKDTDDIQHALRKAWDNPGTQTAYVGLDNVWINNNIFKKYIDGRTHWEDYPEEYIDVKDTQKEVYITNRIDTMEAPARIKFIGFLNDQAIIGSSYDSFYFSETSLYPRNAFQYIEPIWDRKKKLTGKLNVNFNGTPRGMKNVFYELLRTYTGCDDPEDFPGEHITDFGRVFVDKVTIADAMVPDGNGGFKHLYSEEELEVLKARYIRAYGNDALFMQENFCDFTTVNAGLVYRGVEVMIREKRFCPYNLDPSKPVYIAFDIASKGKESDSTAAIVYQYYNGKMFIYDCYEMRGVSLVEAISDISKRDYFHMIRMGVLPWDSERSASSMTPKEEAEQMFPNIAWRTLDKERVDRGIKLVREQLPNMVINSNLCDWIMECFNNYEYKRLEKADDWSPKPMHNKYSHTMDALRYAVMGIKEIQYYNLNADGSENIDWNMTYESTFESGSGPKWNKPWPEHWQRREKKTDGGLYVYE